MTTKNIVFIDSRVAGYETLIAGLSADTEWYLLDANPCSRNIFKITETTKSRQPK